MRRNETDDSDVPENLTQQKLRKFVLEDELNNRGQVIARILPWQGEMVFENAQDEHTQEKGI